MLCGSMTEARLAGDARYFTGKACKYGHIEPRYSLNGACVGCHRMWTAAHRSAGKHKIAFRNWYTAKRQTSPEYFVHQAAKRRAKEQRAPFDLTPEDIRGIWPKDNCCPVTGELFSDIRGSGRKRSPNTPSLDKLCPSRGYVVGNIAIISMRANYMKSDVTDPALFRRMAEWLELVLGNQSVCVKG